MQAIVRQLQSDKRTLSEAISQLNVYYQQKIALIEQQNKHYEEIIEEKDRHVKQARIETEKYEVETRRMIAILDNAHRNFENEKKDLQQSLA